VKSATRYTTGGPSATNNAELQHALSKIIWKPS